MIKIHENFLPLTCIRFLQIKMLSEELCSLDFKGLDGLNIWKLHSEGITGVSLIEKLLMHG